MPYFKIPKCWGQELQKSIGWLMMFDDVSFSNSQQSRCSYGDVSKPILLYFCGMNIIEHPFTRYFWGSLGYQGFDWFSTVAFEAVFSTRWYSGLPSNTPAESCATWVAIGVCTRWWKGSRSCCKYGNSNFTRVYGKHIYIYFIIIEGSLEVKLPTIWTDEKQSREEAKRRERLEERRVEEKE